MLGGDPIPATLGYSAGYLAVSTGGLLWWDTRRDPLASCSGGTRRDPLTGLLWDTALAGYSLPAPPHPHPTPSHPTPPPLTTPPASPHPRANGILPGRHGTLRRSGENLGFLKHHQKKAGGWLCKFIFKLSQKETNSFEKHPTSDFWF